MNEQALQTLYNLARQNGYTDSYAQFKVLMASSPDAVSNMYTIAQQEGYTDSAEQFNVLVGADGGSSKKEEEKKEEEKLTQQQMLAQQNALQFGEYWTNNQDLGVFEDYQKNEDGNWVNEKGGFSLWKEYVTEWRDGTLTPIEPYTFDQLRNDPNLQVDENGLYFKWSGLPNEARAAELAKHLNSQSGDLDTSMNALEVHDDIKEDPINQDRRDLSSDKADIVETKEKLERRYKHQIYTNKKNNYY